MIEQITDTLMNPKASKLVKETKGPVDAFKPLDDREARDALKDGSVLRPGIFSNCAIFGDEEQKYRRYDTKRLLEIQLIALGSEEFSKKDPLKMRLDRLFLENNTSRAVLVEAARKWNIEKRDGSLSKSNERLYSESIDAAQEELYPDYDEEVAQSSINKIFAKICDPARASELLSRYSFMKTKEISSIATLNPEVHKQWHDMLHNRYDAVFKAVEQEFSDKGIELSNETLPLAAKTLMRHLGMPLRPEDPDGWDIVDDMDRSGWVNSPSIKTSYSGKRTLEITWDSFSRLMMHEVIFHNGRAENGSRTGYDALQTGLPGSNDTEEGMALLLEALWTNKDPDALGRDDFRYLAVAFADGELDGTRHSEQETYDFTNDIMKAAGLARLDEFGVNAGAFDHTKRAFRGMPEGKIMRSNYAYRAGKIGAIRTLNGTKLSPDQLFDRLLRGKYDDRNTEQCEIMDEIASRNDRVPA